MDKQGRWEMLFAGIDDKTMRSFRDYHNENPEIYGWFCDFARAAKKTRDRYSAKTIMERVRWEVEMQSGQEFKINNDYTALYARLFVFNNPNFEGFFEFRTLTGLKRAA